MRSVRELAATAADDLLSWDSRLLRTVRALMLRPGHLTREYLAGRRVDHVPPFRLYLLASAVNLGLAAAIGDRSHFFFFTAQPGAENERVISYLPRVMVLLVPVFAGLVALVYARPRRMFAEHFVYALHLHSATFLLACVHLLLISPHAGVAPALGPGVQWASRAVGLVVMVHMYLSLRAVYGRRPLATLLSMAAVMAGYTLALGLAITATVMMVARLVAR